MQASGEAADCRRFILGVGTWCLYEQKKTKKKRKKLQAVQICKKQFQISADELNIGPNHRNYVKYESCKCYPCVRMFSNAERWSFGASGTNKYFNDCYSASKLPTIAHDCTLTCDHCCALLTN